MSKIRSEGNKSTELRLIALFRGEGITGWRRNSKITGRPDFVFSKQRLAVFVDGCFWHGCRWHAQEPKQNAAYWHEKVSRNKRHDRKVRRELIACGWRVLRIWEHSLAEKEHVTAKVRSALKGVQPSR
jgi:DNA mismatch endonuclease (patch repair protein)